MTEINLQFIYEVLSSGYEDQYLVRYDADSLVEVYWSFGGTSVNFYHITWTHIPKDIFFKLFVP
jgi:hypothetical protein